MDATRPLEGKRVLVVEDNYLIADEYCEVLRAAGAVPIGPVASAAAAIEAAGRHVLDGVLLDVKLQGVNSFSVAKYLQSKKVPFLLVTGCPQEILQPRLQRAHSITKPSLPSDLVEAAAQAFGLQAEAPLSNLAPPLAERGR